MLESAVNFRLHEVLKPCRCTARHLKFSMWFLQSSLRYRVLERAQSLDCGKCVVLCPSRNLSAVSLPYLMVSASVTLVLPNLVSFLQFLTLSDFTSLFVLGYPLI